MGRNRARNRGPQRNRDGHQGDWFRCLGFGADRVRHEGHGQSSHRRHLQQRRVHRIRGYVEPAAYIDTARRSLATERLAVDAGAAEKDGATVLTDLRPRPKIAIIVFVFERGRVRHTGPNSMIVLFDLCHP
jgi:hypothetical protein